MAVDYHASLTTLLGALNIPVYYEAFNKEKAMPCITYMEISNPEIAHGDTLAYSDTDYQIKIWGLSIQEVQDIFLSVDSLMREAGFRRTFSTEGSEDGLLYKILRYNGTGYETY